MVNLWFISDTHFNHANMVHVFKLADGSPARKFSSVEEMDEMMIQRWNECVKPQDHVYHLGDLTMHRQIRQIKYSVLDRLQGHKRLLLGNHDADKVENYLKWFEKIYATRVIDRILFTHIPVHPENVGGFHGIVHGHTHSAPELPPVLRIKKESQAVRWVPYISVCVEKTDYRPVSLEELKQRIKKEAGNGSEG